MGRAVVKGCVMLCKFVGHVADGSVGLGIAPDWGLAGFARRAPRSRDRWGKGEPPRAGVSGLGQPA